MYARPLRYTAAASHAPAHPVPDHIPHCNHVHMCVCARLQALRHPWFFTAPAAVHPSELPMPTTHSVRPPAAVMADYDDAGIEAFFSKVSHILGEQAAAATK